MIIYNEPKVTLLARQQYLGAPHIKWKSDSDVAAEQLTEFGGRLCYLSFGKDSGIEGHKSIKGRSTNKSYLENILKVKHGSVIEHSSWSFLFEGISRSLTHELVRHRAGFAYSQLSQRYVDESQTGFVKPPEILENTVGYDNWVNSCARALNDYSTLLSDLNNTLDNTEESTTMKKKRARQAARSVLPNCTETKIVVTGNARAFRHFIEMRGAIGADMEIRSLAIQVLRILQTEAPNLFGDYKILQAPDGTEIIETEYSKV